MKSLKKRLHMITSAWFENQFRCRVLNFFVVFRDCKVGNQTEESYNNLIWSEQKQRVLVAFEICLSRDILSEIMKPRLRVHVVKGMSALPTGREVGWALGKVVLFDFTRKASVLSSFSFSLFCVIQVFTSEMHVSMVRTVACIWS